MQKIKITKIKNLRIKEFQKLSNTSLKYLFIILYFYNIYKNKYKMKL